MPEPQAAEIDAFIAEPKTLDGLFPPWGGKYGNDFQCRWGILDSLQIRKGELLFALNAQGERPSVLAIFGQNMFFRLDLVPETECENNRPMPTNTAWHRGSVGRTFTLGRRIGIGSSKMDLVGCPIGRELEGSGK